MADPKSGNLPGMTVSLDEKIAHSLDLYRTHQPEGEYYGAFSGGKDSVVIKELARLAGVRIGWHYNVTTIDPPEVCRFIKAEHPDVKWEFSKHGNFFARMEKKGFPTRIARWCCGDYKESQSPRGAILVMGVRAAESPRRAKAWQEVTFHTRTKTFALAPILTWTDDDVWTFIRSRGVKYCSLYDEGFKRLGCVGCPMCRHRQAEFDRWPKFEFLWKRSFQRIWDRRTGTMQRDGRVWFGDAYFKDWQGMWDWWMSNGSLPDKLVLDVEEDSCQLALDMHSSGQDDDADEAILGV